MRSIFLVVFYIMCMPVMGQSVRLNLLQAKTVIYKDGVLLYGFRGEEKKYTFVAKFYDKSLTETRSYEKELPGDAIIAYSYCVVHADIIDVFIKSSPTSIFLKLNSKLEEISNNEFNEDIKKNEEEKYKQLNAFNSNPNIDRYEEKFLLFKKTIKRKVLLDGTIFDLDPKEQSFRKGKLVTDVKYNSKYSTDWSKKMHLNGYDKFKPSGFIYSDDKDVIWAFICRGKNEFWDDCIIRFDNKSGDVKAVITPQYSGGKEQFFMTNAFFDDETDNTIVVGQLYGTKLGEPEMVASVVMIYDRDGKLLSQKRIEFPEHKIDAPGKLKLDNKAASAINIGKISKGNYFVILEHSCKVINGHNVYFAPVAYSYFELNENVDITNSKYFSINEFNTLVKSVNVVYNEQFVIVEFVYKDAWKIAAINFSGKDSGTVQDLGTFDSDESSNANNKVMIFGDDQIIVFNKIPKKDEIELTTIKINKY